MSLRFALTTTFFGAVLFGCAGLGSSGEGSGESVAQSKRPTLPSKAAGTGSKSGATTGSGTAGSDVQDGPGAGSSSGSPTGACVERNLTFSADELPEVPASGADMVWGGNATDGEAAPYASDFLAAAKAAKANGAQVFAYLEGPCGDTDGEDDGERDRCANIHQSFNQKNAPGTPNTPLARWKPFTMKQLEMSGSVGVDYCEIDNLSNNVTVPLNPLLKEVKALFDAGKIHCRIVLKNVEAGDIAAIKREVAPTPADANFIAPFHIFEDDSDGQKDELDRAMVNLKGEGAVTIISLDTNHYGSAFTDDSFLACE